MRLGMIGLGRMGANMTRRLMGAGHELAVFDPNSESRAAIAANGAKAADSLSALVAALPAPRILWLMIPAGEATDDALAKLALTLSSGDTIVDGGNSNYKDTQRRARSFAKQGIHYIDCGTSGGVWGLEGGYSLMVGGDEAAVERLRPIFETLAPAKDKGWGRVGPSGAGHFTKMIHNGIEYGLMQAYAEGFSILEHKKDLDLDLHQVADIWRHGSVVRSWLLDLTAAALKENPFPGGSFVALPPVPEALLEELFRGAVLGFLADSGAISQALREKLLGWTHSGFSVHNQVRVDERDAETCRDGSGRKPPQNSVRSRKAKGKVHPDSPGVRKRACECARNRRTGLSARAQRD